MAKRFLILCLLAIATFQSCKKEEDTDDFVTMNISGTAWQSSESQSLINRTSQLLSVTANNGKGVLAITIPGADSVGTFNLVLSDGTPGLTFLDKTRSTTKLYSISNSFTKSHGTLSISKINSGNNSSFFAEGTFSGVAYYSSTDSIVITNGTFQEI
ncbi:MAG TPA: hypothetical protein PLM55_04610 [Chitinophagales bacterium]|nr:hypothetical protein [Chitinophagales bacterium]